MRFDGIEYTADLASSCKCGYTQDIRAMRSGGNEPRVGYKVWPSFPGSLDCISVRLGGGCASRLGGVLVRLYTTSPWVSQARLHKCTHIDWWVVELERSKEARLNPSVN